MGKPRKSELQQQILFLFTSTLNLVILSCLLNTSCCTSLQSDILYDVVNEKSFCESICDRQFPTAVTMPLNLGRMLRGSACCSRGCRYFNIASAHLGKLANDKRKHPNATRLACESACVQAYNEKTDRMSCAIGCYLVANKKHNEAIESQLSWAVYVEDGNNVLVIQPADFEPDDVLTDPGLRSQLTNQAGDRLPETHIRSFPQLGDKLLQVEMRRMRLGSTDLLDCLSRRVGLPKLVVAAIFLLAVIAGVLAALSSFTARPPLVGKQAHNTGVEEPLLPDLPPKYALSVEQV